MIKRFFLTENTRQHIIIWGVMLLITTAGFGLLIAGLGLIVGDTLISNPFVLGGIIFLFVLLLFPLRDIVQSRVDRIFRASGPNKSDLILAFGQEIYDHNDVESAITVLQKLIVERFTPTQFHIYTWNATSEQYEAGPDALGHKTSDLYFPAKSRLVDFLSSSALPLSLGSKKDIPVDLKSIESRLLLLDAVLYYPLYGAADRLYGWIALGRKSDGTDYTGDDLVDLEKIITLTNQAMRKIQTVNELQKQVNDLNVLMRVSKGINVTIQFDDVLELIYTQVNRLIPSSDFWITVYQASHGMFQYAFCLEDNYRRNDKENKPLPGRQDLSQDVIRRQQVIETVDYHTECISRGIYSDIEGLYAWVGVPLNAGAETIGAISLGSREPGRRFSSSEIELLQAIADLVAGALVKTQLLEETNRRAQQLATLNDVARGLTSTLDLTGLLQQILKSATEILNCEAGTLFLVDEDTGELIFEVVTGPVAGELIGKRLPPGIGHVGKVANTGKANIVNRAKESSGWSALPDSETGFKTRDLILVPMITKDKVVGVVELINKKDNMPFNYDDQALLMTFTSNATIALENARLYTQTDQQLAAKVDELSILQRIDRELNASLDETKVMEIMLERAIQQSRADTGFIAEFQEDETFRVILVDGEISGLVSGSTLDTVSRAIDGALTTGTAAILQSDGTNSQDFYSLSSQSQMIVPIQREGRIIGILLLESTAADGFGEDILGFLNRLSDHAAIAITNARLYHQVQEANLAKSEFISTVSHELKNPMTSIRGYTDLLLGEAVGPITDHQRNFLSTVKSNVQRMNTLVSDLADISRIESGRLRLEYASIDIRNAIEESVTSLNSQFQQKDQRLELLLDEDLPNVWGDHERIVQILLNLISNANKYATTGGNIILEARHVDNQWDPLGAPKVILIQVKDDGIGINKEDQAKIFQKFFRSDDSKVRESTGTGLGLNISKHLVEEQGGKIWFESQYRKGTTFSFTIPVARN